MSDNTLETAIRASGPQTVKPVPFEPVFSGINIHPSSLEEYAEHRYRERYDMHTTDIDSYAEYVNERSTAENSLVFINPKGCTSKALLNARDGELAGHCDDRAFIELDPLPAYAMILKLGKAETTKMSQRQLIDFIRDWNEVIEGAKEAVKSFQSVTIDTLKSVSSEEGDFNRELSALEKIEMKAAGEAPPDTLVVGTPPYEHFAERTIEIAVVAHFDDDSMSFKLRVREFETVRLEVATEFKDLLTQKLEVKPRIGTIAPA